MINIAKCILFVLLFRYFPHWHPPWRITSPGMAPRKRQKGLPKPTETNNQKFNKCAQARASIPSTRTPKVQEHFDQVGYFFGLGGSPHTFWICGLIPLVRDSCTHAFQNRCKFWREWALDFLHLRVPGSSVDKGSTFRFLHFGKWLLTRRFLNFMFVTFFSMLLCVTLSWWRGVVVLTVPSVIEKRLWKLLDRSRDSASF